VDRSVSTASAAGRPVSLLEKIGLSDLITKWPQNCIPMGGRVGRLGLELGFELGFEMELGLGLRLRLKLEIELGLYILNP
jgi:hypothetical protein